MIHANIFENSPHIQNATFECFEALRLSVGPGESLLFILQGLFHAAKKVRSVFWNLYNSLYISSQDSLTSFYPIFKQENSKQ